MACKFCGPKLSLCGLVLSVWGIIQLVSKWPWFVWNGLHILAMITLTLECIFQTLMGVFYHIKAVALLEDLPLETEEGHHTIEGFIATVEAGYTQVSHFKSF